MDGIWYGQPHVLPNGISVEMFHSATVDGEGANIRLGEIDFPKYLGLVYEVDGDRAWYGFQFGDLGIKVQNRSDEQNWDIIIVVKDDEILYSSTRNKETAFDVLRELGFVINLPPPIKLTRWLGDRQAEPSGCKQPTSW